MILKQGIIQSLKAYAGLLLAGFLLSASLLSGNVLAEPDVRINGLFSGKAVLVVNGQTKMLRQGESFQGVKLLSANTSEAKLEINGRQQTLGLNQQVASSYSVADKTEVSVPRSVNGHYMIGGAINGRSLLFMVDTGATMIAMSELHARNLGVDLRGGQEAATSTASGISKATLVTLPKVSVGSITLHRIPAVVIEGNFPEQVLLGNSFLSRVEMSENNGVLTLRGK